MTSDQKQAIMVLMNLYNDNHIDEEQYFLLLDFIVSDTKDEFPSSTDKITIVPTEIRQTVPLAQCYVSDGICTNPFHDCVNCPRQFGGRNYTITTKKVEEQH